MDFGLDLSAKRTKCDDFQHRTHNRFMLAYTIRLYDSKKTLSIDAFTESKW